MEDVSFLNKLSILNDIILSSPLFLFSILLFEIALIVYILFKRGKINISKKMVICVWIFVVFVLLIIYHDVFFNLIDNFINYIFTALYFPNLAVYLAVVCISNVFFFMSILDKNINKKHKTINIINSILIDSLLIFIIDLVNRNHINVYEKLTIFSNPKLLVLLELSTGIFTSWIILNLFISLKEKLKKYDAEEYPDMPEIIFN